jgi:protein-L-isoaspartate(D-aspartate) O-methyltransferase
MGDSADEVTRLRAGLVASLTRHGDLSDPRVAAAVGDVPRHLFVPEADLTEAYSDQAIVTRDRDGLPTSSSSQPAIMVIMLEQLQPPAGGAVLEIGAGTGYNAALLAALVGPSGRVVSIDIQPEAAEHARRSLAAAGVRNVAVISGDGAAGWADGAPYDGIIVTAGASDLAPAWFEQLGPSGRLVVPLAIRGVQQCVAFARDGDHLRSVAACEGGFMPLAGAMPNTDSRLPVPDHPGVYVMAAEDTPVDGPVVAAALDQPGPNRPTGLTASALEVGGLRRWLAFREPGAASLTYLGPAEGADASGVPGRMEYPLRSAALQRSAPCILGTDGVGVLDLAAAANSAADCASHQMRLNLGVRSLGRAEPEADRLRAAVRAWDRAGRPGAGRLHIDAYPSGAAPPSEAPPSATGNSDSVAHAARHFTFVVSGL